MEMPCLHTPFAAKLDALVVTLTTKATATEVQVGGEWARQQWSDSNWKETPLVVRVQLALRVPGFPKKRVNYGKPLQLITISLLRPWFMDRAGLQVQETVAGEALMNFRPWEVSQVQSRW